MAKKKEVCPCPAARTLLARLQLIWDRHHHAEDGWVTRLLHYQDAVKRSLAHGAPSPSVNLRVELPDSVQRATSRSNSISSEGPHSRSVSLGLPFNQGSELDYSLAEEEPSRQSEPIA